MARKRKPDDTVNLRLRLPDALRQKLAVEAEAAERSLNSEILWRLGQTFGAEWQRYVAGIEKAERDADELRKKVADSPEFQKFMAEKIAQLIAEQPELEKKGKRDA
jgi:hypothetical protein